jgi:hypothetical protein
VLSFVPLEDEPLLSLPVQLAIPKQKTANKGQNLFMRQK